MMRNFFICAFLYCSTANAAPWIFEEPVSVSRISVMPESENIVFSHLESAGRKNIAESAGWVAVVWEDNRDAVPRCYVALKAPDQKHFGDALRISGKEESAEPVIVGIGGGRFAIAWEEAGHIMARTASSSTLGDAIELGKKQAMQASLGFESGGGLYAVWSEAGRQFQQIRFAQLIFSKAGRLHLEKSSFVDATASGDQTYPSIAVPGPKNIMVGWEDRRAGHTRMMTATSINGGIKFLNPKGLNDFKWRGKEFNYGSGTGAMRVALAARGHDGVIAVWADKRDFRSGYDVYAGLAKGKQFKFGANEKVQDSFGDNISQWHPAVAANSRGGIAVVWDDDRDGSPDLWLSWRTAEGWSDNLAVPGASGPGVQSDPSIVMDEGGNLHVAWVEKRELNSPSGIRYVFGRAQ